MGESMIFSQAGRNAAYYLITGHCSVKAKETRDGAEQRLREADLE